MKDLIRHLVLIIDIVLVRVIRSHSIVFFLSIDGHARIILDQVQIIRIELLIGIAAPLLFSLLFLAPTVSCTLLGIVLFRFRGDQAGNVARFGKNIGRIFVVIFFVIIVVLLVN